MIQFNLVKGSGITMDLIDEASLYITANGGEFCTSKRQIEFYVPEEYSAFVAIKFPFLIAEKYVW